MKPDNPYTWILTSMSLGGVMSSLVLALFLLIPKTSSDWGLYREVSSMAVVPGIVVGERTSDYSPVRLRIPKIHVNATIEHVGLTPQGAMDVPKDTDSAGWFKSGSRPGERGSAVIDGHYGVWKNGKISVFNNLHSLRKGDTLYVENKKGETLIFVVRTSRIYKQNEDTSSVFQSSDEGAHLNLITCQGIWNTISKSYPNRLVVFTDRIR